MADVFISYVEEDKEVATYVADALKSRGFRTWHFLRDSIPGASSVTQTYQEISDANCIVLLISSNSIKSPQVSREIIRAHERDKHILPILLDLTHDEFSSARPEWAQVLGAAACARWDSDRPETTIDAIVRGLDTLTIQSLVSMDGRLAHITFVAEPTRTAEPPIRRSLQMAMRAAWHILRPQRELRVAFSAILRIAQGDRYLLIRNLHRQESFAPIGGVYKYDSSTIPTLDALCFRPQSVGPDDDMLRDLRGFLPIKNGTRMLKWFARGQGRESGPACLTREFEEEMGEFEKFWHGADLRVAMDLPREMMVWHVRRVEEGPETVPGQSYLQYRIFDVFELCDSPQASKLRAQLFAKAPSFGQLATVTSAEIIAGRVGPMAIVGHHAAYLFGSKRYHPDLPMFLGDAGRRDA